MALQFDPNINIPDNNGRVEKIVVSVDICWASLITFAVLLPPTSSPRKVNGVNSADEPRPHTQTTPSRAEHTSRSCGVTITRRALNEASANFHNHGEGPYWLKVPSSAFTFKNL